MACHLFDTIGTIMKKKLAFNTITSFLLQIVTVTSGFILPRLVLSQYGSDVNGLVQSITQFLSAISFLELGVGQVIQSALYKPIAQKNEDSINAVLTSGNRFFRKIAKILFFYVIFLMATYPFIIEKRFDYLYTAFLILSICISSFAQYYYGIIDRLLLNADQKGYIQYISQIIAIILNVLVSVILIKRNASIHIVKFASSLVFLARPFAVRLYVNRNYNVKRNVTYEKEPIEQKWNGIAQHISAFILNGTDTMVLTAFSTLENVSVYSIYHLVVYGVHQLYQSATAGLHSIVGDLWAKQEIKKLKSLYEYIEMVLHFSTVFLFSCTGILMFPFISIYTQGINDVDYIQPVFGILIVLAHASQCIKTTYNILILAGGHYKQTQRCHIISAILNAVISVFFVYKMGLIGVALGTVVSMVYQMTWMAWYNSKNLIEWPFKNFVKQIIVDVLTTCFIVWMTSGIVIISYNYIAWVIMAVKVAMIAAITVIISATITYPTRMKKIFTLCKNKMINS